MPTAYKHKMETPLKLNNCATGVKGKLAARAMINIVANKRCFPDLLLNRGFLVLMTSTTMEAEITDSINHIVLNWAIEEWNMNKSIPKVAAPV